ncbi:MAG: D-inositol-3-phosphate glycosyltransferase [Holosporales bacterium]
MQDKRYSVIFVENYDYGGLERFMFDYINDNPLKDSFWVLFNFQNTRISHFVKTHNIKSRSLPLFSAFSKGALSKFIPPIFYKMVLFALGHIKLIWNCFVVFGVLIFLRKRIKSFCVINGGLPGSFTLVFSCWISKVIGLPKVSMSILSTPTKVNKSLWHLQRLTSDMLNIIDAIHVNAHFIKKEMLCLYPRIRSEKIAVVHNVSCFPAVKSQKKINSNSLVVVGTLSFFSPVKGHIYLIEAIRILKKLGINISCYIGGSGPLESELKQMVFDLGLDDSVVFLGKIENQISFFEKLDVFVFPSLHEGLPYAILEAQSFSLPTIATTVGGIPELIEDGVNGFLVPSASSELLAKSILQLITSSALYDEMAANTFLTAERRFKPIEMQLKLNDCLL